MPTLPPIDADVWDQHVTTQTDKAVSDGFAALDSARAAQDQARQAEQVATAREQEQATQSAQSQLDAVLAPARDAQATAIGTQQAQTQLDSILAPARAAQQQAQAPAMPQGQAQPSGSPVDVGGTDWRAYAAQAAQKAGIDPGLFTRQIDTESHFNPNAVSGAGAKGIAQIVPEAHPGVDPMNPRAALDYAANWMRQLTDRYGGDVRKALAAYNAGPGVVDKYGGVPPFEETQRYVKTIYDDTGGQASPLAPPPTPGQESSQYGSARAPSRVEAVGQFEQGLPYDEAVAICGPVAALAFAQANGRNPDLAEVRALAKQRGWTSQGGMNGVANEQATLTALGVKSRLDTNPDFGHIAQDAASGNPVIISTPVHYYYASDFDPATGKVFVGKTGTSRRGGGSWMTPQEIATLDGGINGALFVDNPQSSTPSVGASGDTSGDRPPSEFEQPSQYEGDRYLGRRPDQPITMGDVGDPTVATGLPRTPLEAIDTGATAIERRVGRAGTDVQQMGDLSLENIRAAHRGESLPPEQAQQLGDLSLSYGLALTGEPIAKVGGEVAATAAGEVARLRLDKFPEEIRSTIEEAAGRGDFWQQQRRNVIPDAEAERMADELGRTVEQMVAGGRAGRAYNTEETRALRNGLVGQALKVDDLKATVEALGGQASDALKRQLGEEQARLLALSRVAEGARAEAGRTFRAYLADTRGRMLRAREPQYTNVSTVPIRAAPELEGAVVQATQSGLPEHRLGDRAPGPVAPEVGRGAEQSTLLDPLAHYRGPRDAGPQPGPLAAFGERADQGTLIDPLEHYRGPTDAGAQPGPLRTLGNDVAQGTLVDPLDYYRGPTDPGQRAAPAPGSATPKLTEQAPLITERVATTGKATNLLGETTTVGAGRMSVYDRASLVRMAGMLSAVPTHLLNIAGNTVMGGLTLASKEAQVGADLARVGIGRALGRDVERQRFQAEVGPQLAGYGRGMWAGLQQVGGILAHGAPQDFNRVHGTRGLASGSAALDTAVEMPLRALAASDAVFRGAAFGGHAAALATRQATQEGLNGAARRRRVQEILGNLSDYPGILDGANKLAARDVFQEARLETDAISRFKQQHVGAKVAGDVFLPFYKTPYNVAAQGAGMTPAGYLGALAAARRGETGEAIDRAVRATVGTGAMAVGFRLATSGLLTGAYPATPTERSTLPEGWKPYSLRIPSGDGAVYVPIQSLGALAVPLGAAAVVVDAQKRGIEKDDPMKAVYAGLGGIGQFMGDMSALQGLNAISKLVTEPERTVESFTESLGASFVPGSGFVRQIQQALGDAQRDPAGPVEAFMAGVPGLSQFVPTKLTSLGDPRARGPSGWLAFLGGGRIGVERDEPVLAAYRGAGASLTAPGTSVLGHAVTPQEQRRIQTRSGELLRERVADWATDPDFRALPADERADILDRARTQAREDAGVEVLDPLSDDELARRRTQYALKRPA